MLGNCPECSGQVASTAYECPHCGHVVRQRPTPKEPPECVEVRVTGVDIGMSELINLMVRSMVAVVPAVLVVGFTLGVIFVGTLALSNLLF